MRERERGRGGSEREARKRVKRIQRRIIMRKKQ